MGYTTDFEGFFYLNKSLTIEHHAYLTAFANTRRMERDVSKCRQMPDPIRQAVGLAVGPDGAYFVGGKGYAGQDRDPSVTDYNTPPDQQPGLWCHWIPNPEGTAIIFDGGEKFDSYVEWIEYLIVHFLAPAGYVLNGDMLWQGEEMSDRGTIYIRNNVVTTTTEDDVE